MTVGLVSAYFCVGLYCHQMWWGRTKNDAERRSCLGVIGASERLMLSLFLYWVTASVIAAAACHSCRFRLLCEFISYCKCRFLYHFVAIHTLYRPELLI